MSRIDLNHTSISTLLERTIPSPYDSGGYLRREYWEMPRAERDWRKERSKLSAPIHGQSSLVGYIFNQVGLGRTSLEPETLKYVESTEGKKIMQHVRDEGGRIIRFGSRRHEYGRDDHMIIGRYIIEWDWGDQPRGHDWAPDAGPMMVHEFDSPEAANQHLESFIEAYEALRAARSALATVQPI